LLIEPLWELRFVAGFLLMWGNFVHMADVNPAARDVFRGAMVGIIGADPLRACAKCDVTRLVGHGARSSFGSGSGAGSTDQSKFSGDLVDSAGNAGFAGNALNALLFVGSAVLFRKAGRGESAARVV